MCCEENAVQPLSEADPPEAPVTLQPPPPPILEPPPNDLERVIFTNQETVFAVEPLITEPSPELLAELAERDQMLASQEAKNTEDNNVAVA